MEQPTMLITEVGDLGLGAEPISEADLEKLKKEEEKKDEHIS
jgi:hypothetical protein